MRRHLRVFAFVSAAPALLLCAHTPIPRSIGSNDIGGEGASALSAVLKETKITTLGCAPYCSISCQRPLTLLFPLGSLANNQLCGLDHRGRGTYTTEGITKLCEALKGSAVTSLECAARPERLIFCQRPLTLHTPLLCQC